MQNVQDEWESLFERVHANELQVVQLEAESWSRPRSINGV